MLILYILLLLMSLVCYGAVIVLSIILSRCQHIVFVYALLLFLIATFVHVFAPLMLFDTYFARPENRRKKRYLFILPFLMLIYIVYVINDS